MVRASLTVQVKVQVIQLFDIFGKLRGSQKGTKNKIEHSAQSHQLKSQSMHFFVVEHIESMFFFRTFRQKSVNLSNLTPIITYLVKLINRNPY